MRYLMLFMILLLAWILWDGVYQPRARQPSAVITSPVGGGQD